jgi:chromosome segregation ATPase
MSKRIGRLSTEDWAFIEANADTLSVEAIADHLNRTIESVRLYLSKIGKHPDKIEGIAIQAEYDLKSRKYWKELKSQFSDEELDLFVFHWSEIVAQFRKDVLPTEELQVIDLIKLELLMNRALREQQTSSLQINELEARVQELKSQPSSDQDREVIFNIERQIASLRAAKESLSREFKDLQSKKSNLYKDLKATREQRIEKLESNKQTLSSLVNRILRDPDFFEEEGKALEKMRLAAEAEGQRLSDYYTYADGTVDQPFLTPDTVK